MRIQRKQECPVVAAGYAGSGCVVAIEPGKVISDTPRRHRRQLA